MNFADISMLSRSTPVGAAKDMLGRYWDGKLPVDPVKIAQLAGVKVYARGADGDPYYGYSGYFRVFNGVPSIEFNVKDAPVRRRFTVAHELGHYALGHQDRPRDAGNFQSSGDPLERAANQFAAALLMPADVVRKLFLNGEFGSAEALAKVFDVSKAAISYRLINLGLA